MNHVYPSTYLNLISPLEAPDATQFAGGQDRQLHFLLPGSQNCRVKLLAERGHCQYGRAMTLALINMELQLPPQAVDPWPSTGFQFSLATSWELPHKYKCPEASGAYRALSCGDSAEHCQLTEEGGKTLFRVAPLGATVTRGHHMHPVVFCSGFLHKECIIAPVTGRVE